MTALADALRLATDELRAKGASFALIGGLAVSVRTEPRFTRDVDLAVAVASDGEAEALVHSLLTGGWHVLAQIEQDGTSRLATTRLEPPPGKVPEGVVVDLLFASSGLEPEIVAAAEPLTVLEGVVVPVASVAHLLALKILAQDERTRPQDRVDAQALLAVAKPADIEETRACLTRIHERGFQRGKDLQREFEDLLT